MLAAGIDVIAASVGALARPGILETWLPAGVQGRHFIPAGAIAGLDGLAAHGLAGLTRVDYTSTELPEAWRGTAAESALDLDVLAEPTCFFDGSPREAALAYPKNANVAATVALAGIGLDDTRVRLVGDQPPKETSSCSRRRAQLADFGSRRWPIRAPTLEPRPPRR